VRLEPVEAGEIDVTAIHDVEGARLDGQMIERLDIVHFPVGNMDETGNVATQVDQRVEFDGRFSAAELGPREETQTKIDGCGIEGVNGLFQVDSHRIFDIQFSSVGNEDLRKVGVNAPVAILVGLGQSVARDRARMPTWYSLAFMEFKQVSISRRLCRQVN